MENHEHTALITGGNGNLGRLVGDELLARGARVIRFDIPGTTTSELGENNLVLEGDIRDSELINEIIDRHRPDTVYHLASLLSGSSEADISEAWEVNATASFNLFNCCQKFEVEKVFFASTAASYGPVDQDPMSLDYAQWPENFYGATKVAVERLGVYFKQKHGMDFRCLRFPLVVSPNAPKTAVSAFPSHAFKAAAAGQPFSFPVSETTGMSTIFLDDVVSSIVDYMAAERHKLTQHVYNLHSYHLSAGIVAKAVKKRFPDFKFDFDPKPAVEHLISSWPDVVDDGSARTDWGWNPKFNFEESADRMYELLVSHS